MRGRDVRFVRCVYFQPDTPRVLKFRLASLKASQPPSSPPNAPPPRAPRTLVKMVAHHGRTAGQERCLVLGQTLEPTRPSSPPATPSASVER